MFVALLLILEFCLSLFIKSLSALVRKKLSHIIQVKSITQCFLCTTAPCVQYAMYLGVRKDIVQHANDLFYKESKLILFERFCNFSSGVAAIKRI